MSTTQRPHKKLLVASHSHPRISKGGAEIAAWRLFEGLATRPDWQTWFMGCARESAGGRLGSNITQPFSDREFLYNVQVFDWFKFSNPDATYPRELEAVLRAVAPDILHFHHYANFGLETFMHIKRILPESRIVLTLHEYQAICNHYGQMVTRENKSLCYASSPRDCNKCFPEFARADFFLRQSFVQRFLALVDQFIAPSAFLADRYVQWGLPASRMTVIENITAPVTPEPRLERTRGEALRVGFFGQLSFLKGIHVLMEAARLLAEDDITFEIHGDYSGQPPEFQRDFLERLAKAGSNVRYHGPYENERVDILMRSVDLVLISSIWWENSPVVIQEALRNRVPIICSNIGGMAEKVQNDRDGLHFPVGDATALRGLLAELARDRKRLAQLSKSLRVSDPPEATIDAHAQLYERALALAPITA